MAPRSKKIRAPSEYFLWAPQESRQVIIIRRFAVLVELGLLSLAYRVQSENPRFSSERHPIQESVKVFDTLNSPEIGAVFVLLSGRSRGKIKEKCRR